MTTKASIVNRVAEQTGLSKRAASGMVTLVMGIVMTDLAEGGVAVLPHLGKLKVGDRPSRVGRNPRTGEALEIPARRVVKFRPAARLRRGVQQQ